MENIKMFKHPNYYKNLRKLYRSRNRNQAISESTHDGESERAPGTGLKQQASSSEDQASSVKPQALKLSNQPG